MPPQPTMAMPIGFMNVSGEYGEASNKDKRGQSVRSEAAVNCLAGWTRRPTLPPMNLLRTFNLAGAFLLLLSIASNAAESRPNFVISDRELTLAQILKTRGYATAIFGKWHLGDSTQFLPTRHGFDEYFGLPYSNDMWPNHPTNGKNYPPLPLIEGEKVVGQM